MRLALLLLAALTLAAPEAWACSYGGGGPLTLAINDPILRKRAEEQAKQTFKDADYIITARILKLFYDQKFKAIIQTKEKYKGNPPNIFEITYHHGSSACGYEFRPNQEPLLVLSEKEGNIYSGGPAISGIFSEGGPERTFLEKLSAEHKRQSDESKETPISIEQNEFLTPMRSRQNDIKPISEQKYILKIKDIIKNCKLSKSIEKIPETEIYFSRSEYISLVYAQSTPLLLAGKRENVLNIWIPYYNRIIDDISFKDKFLKPIVETEDGKTLTLEECPFPDSSTFFEPIVSPQ